ncbi:hypothetical protein KP509_14G078500 [Ceratopteris richardii]|nr:hypothetical protein KP509_14G078500 [Ceratopteris richardii]
MRKGVALVLGPQASDAAYFVAHLANAAQVPILSFGASDPNLAMQQYSYFFRTVPSDALQMNAIATFIAMFGWKKVNLIYIDDDYGAHGASSLEIYLQEKGSKLVNVSKLPSGASTEEIRAQLINLDGTQSRVFVLHTSQSLGLRVLSEAKSLHMFTSGYVWIVTDLIVTALLTQKPDLWNLKSYKGLLGMQRFIYHSDLYKGLLVQWQANNSADIENLGFSSQLDAYAVYAYDSLYMAAFAIASHLAQGHGFKFTEFYEKHDSFVGGSDFRHIKVLESGPALRDTLLSTTLQGASGFIKFTEDGDNINAAFGYVNLVEKNVSVVAYWTNSDKLLENVSINTNSTIEIANATLLKIVWPGGSSIIPRGWVLPRRGQPLRIGIPMKAGFHEIVSIMKNAANKIIYDGFCIKVFEAAIRRLSYPVTFQFYSVQSKITGKVNPEYDDLIKKVHSGEYDIAVGDILITENRLTLVDFTQPYISSGLIMLVRDAKINHDISWAFLGPFKVSMWCTILGFAIFIGIVIWILEQKENEDFHGPPIEQLKNVLWFTFSTFFKTHKERLKGFLASFILILWLFVILVITSSYTASLTALLTVEKLKPEIEGWESLLKMDAPVGYQTGSFVKDFLIDFGIRADRLKDLASLQEYKNALDAGPQNGVIAIVDELPYIELFLATECKNYAMVGQVKTRSGWGFAFTKGSGLAEDLSSEILKMQEDGDWHRLHTQWFKQELCTDTENVDEQPNRLGVKRFRALFGIMSAVSIFSIVLHFVTRPNGYVRAKATMFLASVRVRDLKRTIWRPQHSHIQ